MFHNVQLREDIEKGASGGPQFNTTMVQLRSGAEKSNINWAQPKGVWDFDYGIEYKEEFLVTVAFFYLRQGRAHSFRFKDWSDYELDGDIQVIIDPDGAPKKFQLSRAYTDGTFLFRRNVYLPRAGLVVTVDDVPKTFTQNAWGMITLDANPMGGVIKAYGEFDCHVRFDTDVMQLGIETWEAAEIKTITVVEKRPLSNA